MGGPALDLLGELEDDRDRPERLGEAAGRRSSPGRRSRSAAGSSRRAGAPPGRRPGAGRRRSRRRRWPRRDRSSSTSRPPQPRWSSIRRARPPTIDEALGVDVEEDELVDAEARLACGEPLDQLRRVGAAAADDGDLHAHRPPSRCHPPLVHGPTTLPCPQLDRRLDTAPPTTHLAYNYSSKHRRVRPLASRRSRPREVTGCGSR